MFDVRGFLVTEGKIVQGSEPPATIKAFSQGTFSASGREGTAVAPKGGNHFSLHIGRIPNIFTKKPQNE